jgi:hypothetical protein
VADEGARPCTPASYSRMDDIGRGTQESGAIHDEILCEVGLIVLGVAVPPRMNLTQKRRPGQKKRANGGVLSHPCPRAGSAR